MIEGLRDASLDVALTYDLAIPADLQFVELGVLPPFALFSQTHDLAQRSSVSVSDLVKYPLILLDLPLSSDYFLSFFGEAGLKPWIAERTRDMAVVQSLVANDFGYSIANVRPLTDLSPDGKKLHFVPLTGPVKPMRMGLLCAGGGTSSLTIRAFIDHCRGFLPNGLLAELTVQPSPSRRRS